MAKFSYSAWICSQKKALPLVQPVDLTGQTVVVTGSNIGLGFVAAKCFAEMKPKHLVLACRAKKMLPVR